MKNATYSKERLSQLEHLVKVYRGFNQAELARQLRRDPGRLVCPSGDPKASFVSALAELIEWTPCEVIEFLQEPPEIDEPSTPHSKQSFEELEQASRSAYREGRFKEAVRLAQDGYVAACTGDERVLACNREAVAHDGSGHYLKAMEALLRGAQESTIGNALGRQLRVNLANTYYALWRLPVSQSLAKEVIACFEACPATSRKDRISEAFAHYVLGHTCRRRMHRDSDRVFEHAERSRDALQRSLELYRAIAQDYDDDGYEGIARTLEGGLLEVNAALGREDPRRCLELIESSLEDVVDPGVAPRGDLLESYGWWCIFGCNIVIRHLTDERQVQHFLAVLTEKADEVATRLDNWALWERVFTMDYAAIEHVEQVLGVRSLVILDQHELRTLAGTMGRFPNFRELGRRLFDAHMASAANA